MSSRGETEVLEVVAEEPLGPLDRQLDRRVFLRRMTALTAAVSAGEFVSLTPLAGATLLGGEGGPAVRSGGTPSRVGRWPNPFPRPIALPHPRAIQETDPVELTVAEAASLIRAGDLSPVDLLDAYLTRIEEFDETFRAFNTVVADQARDAARDVSRAPYRGPLHGIPLAIKDNYFTQGVRTTANSHIFADFVPDFDATAWERLRESGAILVGKTQMGPLATTAATTPDGERTTRNAWAPNDGSVSPGGSSSGSATAVAARMAASATGTQTGGSITNPSNAQGLTGIKPTMGRVSLYGIIPLTYTRDHPGPLARDAMDAALMLQAMAGPDERDPRTQGLPAVPDLVRAATPVSGREGLRWPTTIGVLPGYTDAPEPAEAGGGAGNDEERRRRLAVARQRQEAEARARQEMLNTFENLGARMVEVTLPEDWSTLTGSPFNNVRLPERTEPFMEYLRRDVRLFGVSLSPWINGLLMSGVGYVRGQRAKLLLLRRILDDIFAQCDVVVQTRPVPFDIVGLPLAAFPIGESGGRPIGAVLGGQPYAEDRLLSLAAGYQAVTDWHRRRPADPVPGQNDSGEVQRVDLWEVMETGE